MILLLNHLNQFSWIAADDGIVGHIFGDHGVGTYGGILTHGDRAEDFGSAAYGGSTAQMGAPRLGEAYGNLLIYYYIGLGGAVDDGRESMHENDARSDGVGHDMRCVFGREEPPPGIA